MLIGESLVPDHPRACGANYMKLLLISEQNGSSPRVRGKRSFCLRTG